jgi:hypothetical protein
MLAIWDIEQNPSERTNNDNIGLLGVEVKNISKGVQVEYLL